MNIRGISVIVAAGVFALSIALILAARAVPVKLAVTATPSPMPTWPAVIESTPTYIRCASYDLPSHVSSRIYRIEDAGKRGIPRLSPDDALIASQIRAKLGDDAKNLRFVQYDDQTNEFRPIKKVYIFVASAEEVCFVKDLSILNDSSVATYDPAEDRYISHIDNGSLSPYDWPIVAHPVISRAGRYGLRCQATDEPGPKAPASYNVQNIGRAGVPSLTKTEFAAVRRIQRSTNANDLRFTILSAGHYDAAQQPGRFLLYHASATILCASSYQFAVLNSDADASYFPRFLPFELYSRQDKN